jgi:hypothetical protein
MANLPLVVIGDRVAHRSDNAIKEETESLSIFYSFRHAMCLYDLINISN